MGSGTRLKVLQAMAAGKAVVSTSMGAQGLHVTDNVELRIADTATAFADAVIDLLQHPEQRTALSTTGAAHVRAHYDWDVIASRLLNVYDDVSSTRATTPKEQGS
jgi:glycosyltransferase involved in cell wall biosynthesis